MDTKISAKTDELVIVSEESLRRQPDPSILVIIVTVVVILIFTSFSFFMGYRLYQKEKTRMKEVLKQMKEDDQKKSKRETKATITASSSVAPLGSFPSLFDTLSSNEQSRFRINIFSLDHENSMMLQKQQQTLPSASSAKIPNAPSTATSSVYSCCYSSSVLPTLLGNFESSSNNDRNERQRKINIDSSVILMRHFERVDHVDSGWFQKKAQQQQTQNAFCPVDPPLSKNGIRDGSLFSSQLLCRLNKKNRSVEDGFSFIVSSPSLRCLQTSILCAMKFYVPILIEDSVSDYVNRRVFGAVVSERPATSLKKDGNNNSIWWIAESVIINFMKDYFEASGEDTPDDDIRGQQLLLFPGAIFDQEKKRFGFFDYDSVFHHRSENEIIRNKQAKLFKKLPESEKEFSERVQHAMQKLSVENKLYRKINKKNTVHGGSNTPLLQKAFSSNQFRSEFILPPNLSQEALSSSSNLNLNQHQITSSYEKFTARLLVVTHADIIRVAASQLTPRCSKLPPAHDGIAVVYGSLTQMIRLVAALDSTSTKKNKNDNKNDDDNDDDTQESNIKDSPAAVYHLVSFGSRDPSAMDCPVMKK